MTTAGGGGGGRHAGGVALPWVLALAALASVGAWAAPPVPLPVGLVPAALGLLARWPLLLVVGVGLTAAGLGARASAGLEPVAPGPFHGPVQLVTDPVPAGPAGWRAEVRLPGGQRVRATAHGPPGRVLAAAHAGGRVEVVGALRPLARRSSWSDSRRLVGVLAVDQARPAGGAPPLARAAQVVRDAVQAGAALVPADLSPLYAGLVVGDDRFQPAAQRAAFRAAGLAHLLAVSGQNVAFVLLAAGPLLRRLATWPRFAATAAVLVLFATATRYEPSVLRATAVAGTAAWSVALGRPNQGLRVLALAVTGLVLVDPLLVRALGFQLSVAASAGILALAPPLSRALPGPVWFRTPLAVTASAQLAVLPLVAAAFGPVSVASIPANLLAAAPAGLVMTWGLTVGVVAGAAPGAVGRVLQLPAAWSLAVLDAIARLAATTPAPRLGLAAVVPLAAAVAWLVAPGGRGGRRRWLAALPLAGALAVGLPRPAGPAALPGARWCPSPHGPAVLVLDGRADPAALVEAVLDRGIDRIDVVVAPGGGRAAADALIQLARVAAVGPVLAPPHHQIRGARIVKGTLVLRPGPAPVTVTGGAAGPLRVEGC